MKSLASLSQSFNHIEEFFIFYFHSAAINSYLTFQCMLDRKSLSEPGNGVLPNGKSVVVNFCIIFGVSTNLSENLVLVRY